MSRCSVLPLMSSIRGCALVPVCSKWVKSTAPDPLGLHKASVKNWTSFAKCSSSYPIIPPRLYSYRSIHNPDPPTQENESLLENLSTLGVDLAGARQRQPGVLKKSLTNEQGLAHFLQSKGATAQTIASIITRFPRSITRSSQHLQERWELWRSVFKSDSEMVQILSRSPESFFRSSDNKNLAENISFLMSLGITAKELHRLLTTAPRTFSNSLELNRNMVALLQKICTSLGGTDCKEFARTVISKNQYVFIRSTGRISANVDFLIAELQLSDDEALFFLQNQGASILDLSSESLKKNLKSLRLKLLELGCEEEDLKRMVLKFSPVLFMATELLHRKIDCLIKGGVPVQRILLKPNILDFSMQNIEQRLCRLNTLGYNFAENGLSVMDCSNPRFDKKMERLERANLGSHFRKEL